MWLQSHERGLCLQDAAHARSKAHHAQSSVLAVCCQGLVSSSPWRLQPTGSAGRAYYGAHHLGSPVPAGCCPGPTWSSPWRAAAGWRCWTRSTARCPAGRARACTRPALRCAHCCRRSRRASRRPGPLSLTAPSPRSPAAPATSPGQNWAAQSHWSPAAHATSSGQTIIDQSHWCPVRSGLVDADSLYCCFVRLHLLCSARTY